MTLQNSLDSGLHSKRTSTRTSSRIAPKLDKHLFAYAAAATAAGVGMLATSQSAEAKIVYTPANSTIEKNTIFNLDLNNDGVADFSFYFFSYNPRKVPPPPLGYHDEGLSLSPLKAANEVWGVATSVFTSCAAALPAGAKVGPGAAFQANAVVLFGSAGSAYSNRVFCKFGQLAHGAFLGMKFVINGTAHYGWAHVTVSNGNAVLKGYAYETVPNTPIATGKTGGPVSVSSLDLNRFSQPQPATLGLLARGADGLQIWRKEEEQG